MSDFLKAWAIQDATAASQVTSSRFLTRLRRTNFDFYLRSGSAQEVFFELKLSECEFGACNNKKVYRRRLNDIYHRQLQPLVEQSWLEEETFFKNYQILRNVSYLTRPKSRVVFVLPRANECLRQAEETIRKIAFNGLGERIKILYLEDVLERVQEVTKDDPLLQKHFEQFRQKYVVPEAA